MQSFETEIINLGGQLAAVTIGLLAVGSWVFEGMVAHRAKMIVLSSLTIPLILFILSPLLLILNINGNIGAILLNVGGGILFIELLLFINYLFKENMRLIVHREILEQFHPD